MCSCDVLHFHVWFIWSRHALVRAIPLVDMSMRVRINHFCISHYDEFISVSQSCVKLLSCMQLNCNCILNHIKMLWTCTCRLIFATKASPIMGSASKRLCRLHWLYNWAARLFNVLMCPACKVGSPPSIGGCDGHVECLRPFVSSLVHACMHAK